MAKFQKNKIIETESSEGAEDIVNVHSISTNRANDYAKFVTLTKVAETIKQVTCNPDHGIDTISKRLIYGIYKNEPQAEA